MSPKTLVRISNIIGIVSIVLLIYWIFTFISIEVFGLRVFRKHITDTFYMSILGILALMFGALMVNVMFNLSRIAEKHNGDNISVKKGEKKFIIIFLLVFPVIFGFLFAGDYLTSKRKEKLLSDTAEFIINDNNKNSDHLLNYKFEKNWLLQTVDILSMMSKTDTYFPQVEIIVKDSFDDTNVYLGFGGYVYFNKQDTIQPVKKDFIRKTTQTEREYLEGVFNGKNMEKRFSAHDGNYELFYPYSNNGKIIVFYFSEYQQYGKIGSY